MKIGVPKQRQTGETRVALTPGVVGKLVAQGHTVLVEAGAGAAAHASDDQYHQAGASSVAAGESEAPEGIWGQCDLILSVNPPSEAQVTAMAKGAVLMGLLEPFANPKLIQQCVEQGVTAFAMELLPRITRAQAMDVLSSQANLAGYKAAILGADHAPKIFPMMTTAAGTIRPAKVLIVGAGVAGLQAIATAGRLGARVEAYDVRSATKEQVQSLGARFVELTGEGEGNSGGEGEGETSGGYAKEQSEEQQKQQAEQLAKHVIDADVVITTAAVPGKAPPLIIPQDVVDRMEAGTVVVDIAADDKAGRGNCEATRPGQVYTTDRGATIIAAENLPTRLPVHASEVFANNMQAFIKGVTAEGELSINMDDQVQGESAVTHNGEIRNEKVKEAMSDG